MLKKIQGAD